MRPVPRSRVPAVAVPFVIVLIAAAAATADRPAGAIEPDGIIPVPAGPVTDAIIAAPVEREPDGIIAAPVEREPHGIIAAPVNPDPDSSVLASTEEALRSLSASVTRASHADALRTAFHAYYNYRAANPDNVTKPYLYYVDMGLDNRTARGYVFDMDRLTVIDGPFTVAHGRGSSRTRDAVPTSFSNRPGSYATSLGLYLAQETYTFSGKSGGRRYSSVGLRMRGESGEFNSTARRRGIVAHGAPYVTSGQAGRSEGCPAMEMSRAQRLLPMIANGGVVFIYSPKDTRWLSGDPWIAAL